MVEVLEKDVFEQIDRWLNEHNMSKRRLAINAGIAPTTLASAFERRSISLNWLLPITKYTGLDFHIDFKSSENEKDTHGNTFDINTKSPKEIKDAAYHCLYERCSGCPFDKSNKCELGMKQNDFINALADNLLRLCLSPDNLKDKDVITSLIASAGSTHTGPGWANRMRTNLLLFYAGDKMKTFRKTKHSEVYAEAVRELYFTDWMGNDE